MTLEKKKGPTMRYGFLQAGFWIDYLIISNFAALFLEGRGFTSGQIGILVSAASLISCVLAQFIGTFADKSEKVPLKYYMILLFAVCVISFCGLIFLPHEFIPTLVFYLTAYSIQAAISPLLNSLCLQFTNNGYDINFGLARSMGSLGYAIAAYFMGMITSQFGSEIILPIYIVIYVLLILLLIVFPVPQKDQNAPIIAGNQLLDEEPSSMKEFFSKYHRFLVLMIGFIFLWLMNNVVGTYMIYFIKDLGGTSAEMGTTLFVMAISEIPAVMFGSNIMSRIGAPAMLKISTFGGVLKAFLFFIAPNLQFWIWLNISHLLLSGFYQVSAVYYVYSIVGKKDIVKGQSLLGIATTGICPMLASLLGGYLLEVVSLKTILLIGVIVNAIAFVIIWIATDPNRFKNEKYS